MSTRGAPRPVLIIAGVGNGTGTGASTAETFAQAGYRVALIARRADYLKKTADAINAAGGEAEIFPIASYAPSDLESALSAIRAKWPGPENVLRAAVWNTAHNIRKPFLELTQEDIDASLDINIRAAFAFARFVITELKENDLDDTSKRGVLIFTGATASTRGNVVTSAFSAGKHGVRALAQSLSKEFGPQNIHVAHVVIDGSILTDRLKQLMNDPEWEQDENRHLTPESVAKTYLYLANQDCSAWTWELDLRPAHEKW